MIHMKCQDLFFLKTKQDNKNLLSAAAVTGDLRVKGDDILLVMKKRYSYTELVPIITLDKKCIR